MTRSAKPAATPTVAIVILLVAAACVPDVGRRDRTEQSYLRILATEDLRPDGTEALDFLRAASHAPDMLLRRTALRALGRLEDPRLLDELAAHLDHASPLIRSTAAWAVAQSVHGRDGSAAVERLTRRGLIEWDPDVRGVIAQSLGRLDVDPVTRRGLYAVILQLSYHNNEDAPPAALLRAVLGLESLIRRSNEPAIGAAVAERLVWLSSYGLYGDFEESPRIRSLSLSALGETRRMTRAALELALLEDPEPGPRRVAVRYLDAVSPTVRAPLLRAALDDAAATVVIAAIEYLAERPRTAEACRHLITAAADGRAAVRVQALRALGRPCPGTTAQRRALGEAIAEIDDEGATAWQPGTAALASLTAIDPGQAERALPSFAAHPSPFVRAHAARAAGALERADDLRGLAADPHPNVRSAALGALFELEEHAVDDLLLAQLQSDDPYLLLTVAQLLEGSPGGTGAAGPLLDAFERISLGEHETLRDPRRALLARVAELGDRSLAVRLEPFLRDYDARVAQDVAGILEAWTGRVHDAAPEPLGVAPLPDIEEIDTLADARVVLRLEGGRALTITPLADVALRNSLRLVTLAREGHYDGLTFHRWAPNFVIQGGSPGANEYAGASRFTRDEVEGLSHWRGTVGISTRGRDTGDGQIFVNLVDNVRLDHQYTVVGVVTEGEQWLDTVLEGTVIERAEVR